MGPSRRRGDTVWTRSESSWSAARQPSPINGDQKDSDADGIEDVCDPDVDGDDVVDTADDCPTVGNADQADLGTDGNGDACDDDIDGDGVDNTGDAFPINPAESKDSDGDGVGDNGDAFPDDAEESVDSDRDGVGDNADNCGTDANEGQADLDGERQGDACDADDDGDGVNDYVDNAPRTSNANQQDLDKDGIGDVVDPEVPPLSANMCKNDGWKRFYDGTAKFKNQGDCVSFVSRAAGTCRPAAKHHTGSATCRGLASVRGRGRSRPVPPTPRTTTGAPQDARRHSVLDLVATRLHAALAAPRSGRAWRARAPRAR